jgi:hypothetical protein
MDSSISACPVEGLETVSGMLDSVSITLITRVLYVGQREIDLEQVYGTHLYYYYYYYYYCYYRFRNTACTVRRIPNATSDRVI